MRQIVEVRHQSPQVIDDDDDDDDDEIKEEEEESNDVYDAALYLVASTSKHSLSKSFFDVKNNFDVKKTFDVKSFLTSKVF